VADLCALFGQSVAAGNRTNPPQKDNPPKNVGVDDIINLVYTPSTPDENERVLGREVAFKEKPMRPASISSSCGTCTC